MPSSNPPLASTAVPVRQPRLRVFANGMLLNGVIEAEIVSNNHYAADRFDIIVTLHEDPWADAAYWASESGLTIDLQISLDGGAAFVSLIQGAVDTVDIDAVGGTVRIAGRDLTAGLIESRTQETFSNRTSSEIARILADRHGLDAQVTETDTPVGRYYQSEHDRITLGEFSRSTTEWDLLVFLARQEGFDVFVSGSTLFFQASATPSNKAVLLRPNGAMNLRLERALTLARDIEVTVKSWNSRHQSAFTQTARASGPKVANSGPAQRCIFVRPNLTPDQALKLAQQQLAELTRHERVIAVTMPGDLTTTPRSLLVLEGSGTEFDRTYYVDEIERQFRLQGGFTQHLRAKNLNPQSQSTPPADIVASVTG